MRKILFPYDISYWCSRFIPFHCTYLLCNTINKYLCADVSSLNDNLNSLILAHQTLFLLMPMPLRVCETLLDILMDNFGRNVINSSIIVFYSNKKLRLDLGNQLIRTKQFRSLCCYIVRAQPTTWQSFSIQIKSATEWTYCFYLYYAERRFSFKWKF